MQLTFQKYEVGHVFKLDYVGHGFVPYVISRIIPINERSNWADSVLEARFHRQYTIEPVMDKFLFTFEISEDEADSMQDFKPDELDEYIKNYTVHKAKNCLLDIPSIF